eukprot:2944141-Rhodomonas_salina.1
MPPGTGVGYAATGLCGTDIVYASASTDIRYAATICCYQVLSEVASDAATDTFNDLGRYAIILRTPYAMPGTAVGYAATHTLPHAEARHTATRTDVGCTATRTVFGYAATRTDVGYAATRQHGGATLLIGRYEYLVKAVDPRTQIVTLSTEIVLRQLVLRPGAVVPRLRCFVLRSGTVVPG